LEERERTMIRIFICLFCFSLFNFTISSNIYADEISKEVSNYKGAWFDIKYPSDFKVKPSIKSSNSTNGYDSVWFASKDGSVEFYVFSPQWNGNPVDIELKPNMEEYVARKEEKGNSKIIRFVTIRALDNTYFRSYVDTENTALNTRLVFGIKYRSQKDYDKYKQYYLDFKKSLRQYAD
jgi:hypothetical protein